MNDVVFAVVAATCADITCTMKKTNQGPKNMFVVTKTCKILQDSLCSILVYMGMSRMQSVMFVLGGMIRAYDSGYDSWV